MSDSAGRKLAQARLQRGLTIDEAAHATKLRPEKIVALESDDYASFPSNAYAKGFLKNYARYLGVDVSAFLASLDSTLPISVADYQYLNNAPERPAQYEPLRRNRKPPSILPLIVGAMALVVAAVGFWIYANFQRIFGEPSHRTTPRREAAGDPFPPPVVATPAPALPEVRPEFTAPATLSLGGPPAAPAAPEMLPAAPARTEDRAVIEPGPGGNSPDRDFVTPVSIPTPDATVAVTPPSGVNEILVASIKKTWITVRKDDPKAPPIFDDFVYPDARPLKLRGTRFFIEARDPSAVQITKNGLPIAYQAGGVPIQ